MPRVRLWVPWQGPDNEVVPPGEEVDVSPEDAVAICASGMGEPAGPSVEVAAVTPARTAVARPQKMKRRKGRK